MAKQLLLTILPPFWPKMPPLGLGFLQAFLNKNGFPSEIYDLNNYFYNLADTDLKREWLVSCNIRLEQDLFGILKSKYSKEFDSAIEKMLACDIIGFSCYKSNFYTTQKITQELKSRKKEIKIILGGPEICRQFFKNKDNFGEEFSKWADYFVVGEGEKPLLNLVSGRQTKRWAEFEQMDTLSDLNFPRYAGLNLENYPGKVALPLQFSRGCIRKCRFCSERLIFRGYRARSIESLIEEIRFYKERHGIKYFVFFDSLLNADLAKFGRLCGEIINNFGSINWEAQVAVRNDMPDELFLKMKKSGCYNLFVGLESGCNNTLLKMQKGFSKEEAIAFFKKLNSAGLNFGVSIIVGYPGETDSDFQESLDFIVKNKVLIPKIEQVNPFTYYDGTEADKGADYKLNKIAFQRMEIFMSKIKEHGFKFTKSYIGNLLEKNA
ncbi:MAG: B12-binding domain-containing radical SAM protein [Candidatus Omnitrophica bacterium]|nr:B12-binding domain-containing radical SAM protein [Candidatus Omnitrophota bacterium]